MTRTKTGETQYRYADDDLETKGNYEDDKIVEGIINTDSINEDEGVKEILAHPPSVHETPTVLETKK